VSVHAADGAPVSGRALLAGTRFDVVAGRASIGGVPAGVHTLVVVADDGAGATATFTLGTAGSFAVTLPRPSADVVSPADGPFPGDEPGPRTRETSPSRRCSWTPSPGYRCPARCCSGSRRTRRTRRSAATCSSRRARRRGRRRAVPWDRSWHDAHWVAIAPGYARATLRGQPPGGWPSSGARSGRVVDRSGASPAPSDLYLGCGHGPSAAVVVGDAERFEIARRPSTPTSG
jgi:hypothetical protein